MCWKFWQWLIWNQNQPKYVESGKDALNYIKAELSKTQGKMTESSQDKLIKQVMHKFSLSEETVAGFISTALTDYQK